MSIQDTVEDYCAQLRRGAVGKRALPICKRTAEILRLMVTNQKHADASALIDEIRAVGLKLQQAKPSELSIGNIVRRVLHIIREEVQHEAADEEDEPSERSSDTSKVRSASLRPSPVVSHAGEDLHADGDPCTSPNFTLVCIKIPPIPCICQCVLRWDSLSKMFLSVISPSSHQNLIPL